jgi:hypothetical protein
VKKSLGPPPVWILQTNHLTLPTTALRLLPTGIVKDQDGKWREIGAAWKKASGSFGVVLDPESTGASIKCLMVDATKPSPKKKDVAAAPAP